MPTYGGTISHRGIALPESARHDTQLAQETRSCQEFKRPEHDR